MLTEEELFDAYINKFYLYRSGLMKVVKIDKKEARVQIKEFGVKELQFLLESALKLRVPVQDIQNFHARFIQGIENFDL